MSIADAARAVARAAALVEDAGPGYAYAAPNLTPTGSYSKWHRDLVIDLEWLATASFPRIQPASAAAAIRDAAADALVALTDVQANEYFLAALKTAITENTAAEGAQR